MLVIHEMGHPLIIDHGAAAAVTKKIEKINKFSAKGRCQGDALKPACFGSAVCQPVPGQGSPSESRVHMKAVVLSNSR